MNEKALIGLDKILINSRTTKASEFIIDLIRYEEDKEILNEFRFQLQNLITDREIQSEISNQEDMERRSNSRLTSSNFGLILYRYLTCMKNLSVQERVSALLIAEERGYSASTSIRDRKDIKISG